MEILGVFGILPPLRTAKSPGVACLIGFVFGGIGLAIYLRSLMDGILPIVAVILFALFTGSELGMLGGAAFAGLYGLFRVLHSNAKLEEAGRQLAH
jgi:hypothetical protein